MSPTTPVIQSVSILGLGTPGTPGAITTPGFISQEVPVSPGCCYTLSFEAQVRDNGILVASVSFPGTALGPCTPLIMRTGLAGGGFLTTNPIFTNNIPHIVTQSNHPSSVFQHYTLVVCAPVGATTACITFQNIGNPAPGGEALVDNVVFQNTGGPCPSCSQNF
ncbi:hypothetical protein PMEGAPR236_57000 [Priestia megaterium]